MTKIGKGMSDNEKAAIAAGLWESFDHHVRTQHDPNQCARCLSDIRNPMNVAPDMHDPVNWAQGLDNLKIDYMICREQGETKISVNLGCAWCYGEFGGAMITEEAETLNDAVFAALVALYDAEHPEEKAGAVTVG